MRDLHDVSPNVTPIQARQGFLDRPVLAVLVVSLILAGGALLTAYIGVW